MFVYRDMFTDEALTGKVNKIIRKIRMNAGQLDVYLICLAMGRDNFDIIHAGQLKQKCYPKDMLYICGMAKGKESATMLAIRMYLDFMRRYQTIHVKGEIMREKEELFRRR